MPTYKPEELKTLQYPYGGLLDDSDALVENRATLDNLSYSDKIELATNMITACPTEELRAFSARAESLRHHEESAESFHSVLSRGLEVRQRIQAIANPNNPHPQNDLLGREFNADLFNEFSDLKTKLVADNLDELVFNLATKTTDEQARELNKNIRTGLSETELAPTLRNAFLVKRLLASLTSSNPQEAFTSPEFNPGLFHEYPRLVKFYLAGHEAEIAQKLALSSEKNQIGRQLEALKVSAIDGASPLDNLYAAFQKAVAEDFCSTPVVMPVAELTASQLPTNAQGGFSDDSPDFCSTPSIENNEALKDAQVPTIVCEEPPKQDPDDLCGSRIILGDDNSRSPIIAREFPDENPQVIATTSRTTSINSTPPKVSNHHNGFFNSICRNKKEPEAKQVSHCKPPCTII
ncbi:Uncharacterised protein [Legionella beliardensis]|uniref:Uncharacterized protein n=1 Tax=Legionella beliardensis TaxID=91822 RepID=A0A378ICY0_9GAMM|nr:lpg0008 family Dot/Icm T4SS effector [Legionella beliardensis]STX30154.1 Uncharacterised protein [Legionella beliardensis]